MNNCHKELVWLVSNRLKPINKPIKRIIILGPYLSEAQPPKIAKAQLSTIEIEKTPEVAARVKSNSLSMDVKKTPKEKRVPKIAMPIIRKATTTTQP